MDSIPRKVCTRCGATKPLAEFHKRADQKDGHAFMCKACQSGYDRRPERMAAKRERFQERYDTDPEFRAKRVGFVKKYYRESETYHEATRRRVKVWQRAHKDRVNANARRRYEEYYGEKDRARRQTEEYRARKRETERIRLSNPEARERQRWVLRQYKYRRRAWLAKAGDFTHKEWRDLCKQYGNHCLCCGHRKKLTADHVIPLSKGGRNTIDNIQPLCRRCNTRKGTKGTDYRTTVQLTLGLD